MHYEIDSRYLARLRLLGLRWRSDVALDMPNWADLPEFKINEEGHVYIGPPKEARGNHDVCGIYVADVRHVGRVCRGVRIRLARLQTAMRVGFWNFRHSYQLERLLRGEEIDPRDIAETLEMPTTEKALAAFELFKDPAPFQIAHANKAFWEKLKTQHGS